MANIEYRPTKKGEDRWRVQIRIKGFPEIGRTFNTKEEAELFSSQTESALRESLKEGSLEFPKLPFSVWIDRWNQEIVPHRNQSVRERKMVAFWESALKNRIAVDISPVVIEGMADNILKTESKKTGGLLSFESRRKYLLLLSCIYNTAIKNWKWAIYNPLTGVNMIRKERETPDITKEFVPNFLDFKEEIHSVISKKMKEQKIYQREAAKKCGLSQASFQHVIDKEKNTNLSQLLKVLNGFEIRLKIEE